MFCNVNRPTSVLGLHRIEIWKQRFDKNFISILKVNLIAKYGQKRVS